MFFFPTHFLNFPKMFVFYTSKKRILFRLTFLDNVICVFFYCLTCEQNKVKRIFVVPLILHVQNPEMSFPLNCHFDLSAAICVWIYSRNGASMLVYIVYMCSKCFMYMVVTFHVHIKTVYNVILNGFMCMWFDMTHTISLTIHISGNHANFFGDAYKRPSINTSDKRENSMSARMKITARSASCLFQFYVLFLFSLRHSLWLPYSIHFFFSITSTRCLLYRNWQLVLLSPFHFSVLNIKISKPKIEFQIEFGKCLGIISEKCNEMEFGI